MTDHLDLADHRPDVYEDGGQVVYRASSLGGCLVSLAAARQGYEREPLPKQVLNTYQNGVDAEDWFFKESPAASYLTNKQVPIQLRITKKIVVRGHADALATRVWEVKSQTHEDYHRWTPEWWETDPMWQKYAWQVSVYMLATGMEGVVARVKRPKGMDGYDSWTHIIEKPFHDLAAVRDRVFAVEALAREENLSCSQNGWFCSYKSLHRGDEVTDEPELSRIAEDYLAAKASVEKAQGVLAERRREVEAALGSDRTKAVLVSGHRIVRSEVVVKEHLVKESKQVRLKVTAPKEES